ncbi:MAG: hypothetical protein CM1200mP30_34580 [Pseudomonadota bacterium]|nr:MAG: hypothetical protein CM1200mP30_34580 [Pseudomonadota bacterium]
MWHKYLEPSTSQPSGQFFFFSHQLGAFLGVWLGGRVYDATGTYTPVWLASIALGLLAGIIHLPIREQPWKPSALELKPSGGD